MADGLGERHLAVCRRFGESVCAANGKWDRRSPCDAWDARGVLEHVIGFHDVLLLRPLGLKPDRPRDDPQTRWELTYGQLEKAFEPGRRLFESVVDIPELQGNPAVRRDAPDVAERDPRCVGAHLGPGPRGGRRRPVGRPVVRAVLRGVAERPPALSASGMFDAPVAVGDQSDVQSKLLARLGRNPDWRP